MAETSRENSAGFIGWIPPHAYNQFNMASKFEEIVHPFEVITEKKNQITK